MNVLFLKDEALLTQTLAEVARRYSLYVQNETRVSVSVHILCGTLGECHDMSPEEALKLVVYMNYALYSL